MKRVLSHDRGNLGEATLENANIVEKNGEIKAGRAVTIISGEYVLLTKREFGVVADILRSSGLIDKAQDINNPEIEYVMRDLQKVGL